MWAERFKSVLVEARSGVMRTMAAYIDLNPVRAGLVVDPKDYRFCGYAESVAGHKPAQKGLAQLIEGGRSRGWRWFREIYRETLFGKGAAPKERGATIDAAALRKTIKAKGGIPLHEVLRCRVRYFSDGAVLGKGGGVCAKTSRHLPKAHRKTKSHRTSSCSPSHRLGRLIDFTGVEEVRFRLMGV